MIDMNEIDTQSVPRRIKILFNQSLGRMDAEGAIFPVSECTC